MTKKKRVYVKRLTAEELVFMSDDELNDKLAFCKNMIDRAAENFNEAEQAAWEVEYVYLERELLTRRARVEIHERYVKDLREQEMRIIQEEEKLPIVNFDNFVCGRNNGR